ncbi:MAG: type II toxin-antitoxin system VapC family toxin [Deltaproteobacteria bacterium]|nr:type II toxin-antitoxin system VapC family toxin [Deltaproteobacteria bacterium]
MILYLDTSSLVKLYVEETNSGIVKNWVKESEIAAVCRVAYPEMISALNKRLRCGDISSKEYRLLVAGFSKEWLDFAVMDFDEIEAGQLAEKYGLRGFDAVHLSSAKLLRAEGSSLSLAFSSFDKKLNQAASSEGFTILPPLQSF